MVLSSIIISINYNLQKKNEKSLQKNAIVTFKITISCFVLNLKKCDTSREGVTQSAVKKVF